MPRVARNRTRPASILGLTSRRYWFGNNTPPAFSGSQYVGTTSCSDAVGRPVVDGPFTSQQVWRSKFTIDILAKTPIGPSFYHGEWVSWCPTGIGNAFSGMTSDLAPPGWMLDLVAGTNPSRPVLTIPTLLQNIKELPSMIRELGKTLQRPRDLASLRGIANTHLGIRFGWLPLLDDLVKIIGLQQHILKRTEEIYRLYYQQEGLRRRLSFGQNRTVTTTNNFWSLTSNCLGSTTITTTETRRQWGSIKWKPTSLPPFQSSDVDFHKLAHRIVAGITPEALAKGVWDVIPWTWLIGWFSNVGKYLWANSYTIPAVHSNGCYMSSTDRLIEVGPTTYQLTPQWSRHKDPAGYAYFTRKTRVIGGAASGSAFVPYIDTGRLSVLGSLFVQRFMRR